jgi:hypothetical protein
LSTYYYVLTGDELGRLDFMSLYSIRKAKFIINVFVSTNPTLRFISSFYINSTECKRFLGKNELHADMSHVLIKNSIVINLKLTLHSLVYR